MSVMAFVAFVSVLVTAFGASVLASKAGQVAGVADERKQLVQLFAAAGLLMVAVTTVPMFVMNGLMEMSLGVLVTTQAGVLAFVGVLLAAW